MALTIKARLDVELPQSWDIWTRKYPITQVPAPNDVLELWNDEEPGNIRYLPVAQRMWNFRGDEVTLLLAGLLVRGRRVYIPSDRGAPEPFFPDRSGYEVLEARLGAAGWKRTEG